MSLPTLQAISVLVVAGLAILAWRKFGAFCAAISRDLDTHP